ncbi:MAG TPA: low-complexity protein [Cyanobacteria bacterium UBA8803]|nr:low-complexity protein [Cyanobacteria bacterium UBA9273]HBL60092.1 low-complexity protein [Cyanobacteria bacterium UBA8803]
MFAGLFTIWLLLLLPTPALAATPAQEPTPLTLEMLQQRLNSPIKSDGVSTIDLRQLRIDLTNQNAEFRDQFYQQLQNRINRSKTPLGIDLSGSFIQGTLTASKLGLVTPLSKAALSPLLTPLEQEQLERDARFLRASGEQIRAVTVFRGVLKLNQARLTSTLNLTNTFFLQRVEALDAIFIQEANWFDTRFARSADFSRAKFNRDANFSHSTFLENAEFRQVQFRGMTNFTGTTFYSNANFTQAEFAQLANFSRIQWLKTADFSQAIWRDRSLLNKSRFNESLLLSNATFEKSTTFRESQFYQPVLWSNVSLLDQVDFSNARFAPKAYLDVEGLTFDSETAKIFGDAGEIGQVMYVPILEGNEDVLRNLVRNFRQQQQIADANKLEYTQERLRRQQLHRRLLAGVLQLIHHGALNGVSTNWVLDALQWLGLSLLLLLSKYGTSFGLVFGVGMVAIAYFGLLFWLLDRWRRRYPKPILPTYLETACMVGSFATVTFSGAITIFRTSEQPWFTLLCLTSLLLPVPLVLVGQIYQQGRYHDLLDVTYFVEDGSMRQFRLLIGRLPVIPRFPFFRDRYMPILWERRWNWLNYYDFSLNNLLKFGFNDIRLRDEHLPGIITALAWYQWSLGLLYIALLLWTLSRTIPGLNLLIYLK